MDRYQENFRGEKEELAICYSLSDGAYGCWDSWEDYGVACIMIIRKPNVLFIDVVYGWIWKDVCDMVGGKPYCWSVYNLNRKSCLL